MDKHQKHLEQLNKENEELKQKIIDLENNWKRALADYQNLEKRQKEEKTQYTIYIIQDFLKKLLPAIDLFEKANQHLHDDGLDLALKEFHKILTDFGIEEINNIKVPFDPSQHEAIDIENGEKDNEVLEIYSKGYRFKNYLIRPAKVKVSKK